MKISDFINNLGSLPKTLPKKELTDLLVKASNGDMQAREKIIIHNMRLVFYVVNKKFSTVNYDKEYLISIGLEALVKAMDTYDVSKGFEFSTYAIRCINNDILMFLRKLKKDELLDSFDKTISTDKNGNDMSLEDVLKDDVDIVMDYETEQIYKLLRNKVNELEGREKNVIELYYGFNGNRRHTQQEVADMLGISRTYVSRINDNAINKLRVQLHREGIVELKDNLIPDKYKNNIKCNNGDTKGDLKVNSELNQKVNNINDVIKLIKSGKFDDDCKTFICGKNKIQVKITQGNCLIASVNIDKGIVNRHSGISKKCFIYRISMIDENGKIINKEILLKDKSMKKYYKYVTSDGKGNYYLGNVLSGEIVCYGIENEEVIHQTVEPKKIEKKITSSEYIQKLYNDAMDYFQDKDLVQAEECFNKLLEITSDSHIITNANRYLGDIYKRKKKFIIAEKYYKNALEYESDYYVLLELGRVLREQKKYQEALQVFEDCSKFNNRKFNHLIEKARTYDLCGNTKSALELLNKCIDINENEYNAHYEKANILFKLRRYDECMEEIEECDYIREGFNNHMVIRGKIEFLTGNIENAIKIFDNCVLKDQERNVMYSIIDIGYFFHKLGDEELAYKYYKQTPMFPKWIKLSNDEINNHFQAHKQNNKNEKMHSIFNEEVSLSKLETYIKKVDKTGIRQLYDVYQIYWPNIGTMLVDEKTSVKEDYLTIFTLPFSKKIMMCYPDFKFDGEILNEPVRIYDLVPEKPLQIEKHDNAELSTNPKKEEVSDEEVNDSEKYNMLGSDNMEVKVESTENELTGFYSKFKGFAKSDIDEAYELLDNEDRQIVLKYHNNDLNNEHIRGSLNSEEKIKYAYARRFIERRLNNKSNFYTRFEGFTVKQVNDMISKLCSNSEFELLKKYHNGNLSKPKVNGSLNNEEKKKYDLIIRKLIYNLTNENDSKSVVIQDKLNVVEHEKSDETRTTQSQSEINNMVQAEIEVPVEELETKNGSLDVISDEVPSDGEKLNKVNLQFKIEKSTTPIGSSTEENSSVLKPEFVEKKNNEITKEDYIKMLELLKTPFFKQMNSVLSTKESVIISLKLGYVDGKYFSTKSIAQFLGMKEQEVGNVIKNILFGYKKSLNDFIDNFIDRFVDDDVGFDLDNAKIINNQNSN